MFLFVFWLAASISLTKGVGASLWPAGGVALGVLLLYGPATRLRMFAALLVTGLFQAGFAGEGLVHALIFNTAELLAAWNALRLIVRLVGERVRFGTMREVGALVGAAVLAPALPALAAAWLSATLLPTGALPVAAHPALAWWVASTIGMLIVAPLLVGVVGGLSALRRTPPSRIAEGVGMLAVYVLVTWLVLMRPEGTPPILQPFLLYVLIGWMAVRFGIWAASTSVALLIGVAALAHAGVTTQLLPEQSPAERLIVVQFYAGLACATSLLLAAGVRQYRAAVQSLQALGDNLPNGMVYQLRQEHDGRWRFAYVSSGVMRLNGLTPEALMADSSLIYRQVLREDRPLIEAASNITLDGVHNFDVVVRLRRADGELRWMHFCSRPRRHADGRLIWDGIETDITERKLAEAALEREHQLLESVIDHAPDEIVVTDTAFRYVLLNKEGMRLRGVQRASQFQGRTAYDLFPREVARQHQDEDARVLATGQPMLNVERQISHGRFGERWVSTSKLPLRNHDGAIFGLLTVNRDITERHRSTEALARLNAELEERVRMRTAELEDAVRELDAFAYSVSHDLRAPLRRISGFSHMLLNGARERLTPRDTELFARIESAVDGMGKLIDGLLAFAHIMKHEIQPEPVDLSALAEEIVAGLRDVDPTREVAVDIAPALHARGDANLLRVVLDNLIGNAWKFTAKTAHAAIFIGRAHTARGDAFCIHDNGAGFDMQYARRLFSPFQRLHHQSEFPGTGVGLATVSRIIQRHGGEIWVQAAPGKGASFFFTLGRASARA